MPPVAVRRATREAAGSSVVWRGWRAHSWRDSKEGAPVQYARVGRALVTRLGRRVAVAGADLLSRVCAHFCLLILEHFFHELPILTKSFILDLQLDTRDPRGHAVRRNAGAGVAKARQ